MKSIEGTLTRLANKLSLRGLWAAAILLPALLALLLPTLVFGKSVLSFVPNSSDEIIYWREIKTFTDVGFNGGQYSTNEEPAAFAPSPFGSHGPAFTILYGLWGKTFGWGPASAVVIHLLLFPLATFAAIKIAQPDKKQLLVLTLLLVSWWPLQLYMPSNMQEVLHMLIGLVLAALFYQLLEGKKPSPVFAIAGLLLFGLLLRLTWAFLFFPLFLFAYKRRTWQAWLAAAAGSGLAAIAGVLFVRFFYSPYPWFSNQWLEVLAASPRSAAAQLAAHFFEAAQTLVWPQQDIFVVNALRYLMLGLIVINLVWLARTHQKTRAQASQPLFHLINLGSVLLFVLLFYDVLDTRDFRMYIAPLLLSGALLVFTKRWKFVYGLILFNLIFFVPFVGYYAEYRRPNFHYDPAVLAEVNEVINPVLQLDVNAERWCKTISISKYGRFNPLAYPLTAIPGGFGISTILDWKDFRDRPMMQARYVWLDPEYSVAGFGYPANQFDLIELVSTSIGTLYENPAANCSD